MNLVINGQGVGALHTYTGKSVDKNTLIFCCENKIAFKKRLLKCWKLYDKEITHFHKC